VGSHAGTGGQVVRNNLTNRKENKTMTPDAFWAAEMQNRRLQQEQEQYNQRMLMEGITQVAGAYGQYKDDKNQREAMNTTVMAMKDEKNNQPRHARQVFEHPARTAAIRVRQLLPAPTCILECGQIGRIPRRRPGISIGRAPLTPARSRATSMDTAIKGRKDRRTWTQTKFY
jgi:hypothetical protein